MKIKIATWNVNSIKSRIPNVLKWLETSKPDILLLQELKCTNENFPYLEFENLSYNIEVVGQKAYNGVAIFSRFKLDEVVKFLPLYNIEREEDKEARYIETLVNIDGNVFSIASVYLPNGTECNPDNLEKLDEREKFYHKLRFYERLRERFKIALHNGEKLIMGGDFNTCPELVDMYSIKKDGDICCHRSEKAKLREILNLGISDVLRKFHVEHDIIDHRINNFSTKFQFLLQNTSKL